MVSIARIGLLLTYQWIQSYLFYDVIKSSDPHLIKFSFGLTLFILSYLWSAHHLLKDHRETIYVFNLALYTISQTVLFLSKDKSAHFMASAISCLACLLTAISKGSFTEFPSSYESKFDPSWLRFGHLLANLFTAGFVYFLDPASINVFSIFGVLCSLQLVHIHQFTWSIEKIISNVLFLLSLFLINVYVSDLIAFGSIQRATSIGFLILSIMSTSFRSVLRLEGHWLSDASSKGFFLFLFVMGWAIVELLVKSHVEPVQQLDFWTFFCITLMITSILVFFFYWDVLCYAYLYFLLLVFFYFLSIGVLWILFQGDPFQSSKILWFTPLLLVVFPLVYRFVRYE